jgi:hypothetical protein
MGINEVIGVEEVIWKGQADIGSGVRASFKNLYNFGGSGDEKVGRNVTKAGHWTAC